MSDQLRGPFEKFVDWWQCAAVIPPSALQGRTVASPRSFQRALEFTLFRCNFKSYMETSREFCSSTVKGYSYSSGVKYLLSLWYLSGSLHDDKEVSPLKRVHKCFN
jgi:hypothetical protein